jgi:exopolysaccharide biosynthesis polyprenyl glycosylphosphotransferase
MKLHEVVKNQEYKSTFFKILIRIARSYTHVAILALLAWSLVGVYMLSTRQIHPISALAFATFATLATYVFLHAFDYCDRLRLVPRKSDITLLFTANIISGAIAGVFTKLLTGDTVSNLIPFTISVVLATLFVFVSHYLINLSLLRHGRLLNIVFDGSSDELVELERDFYTFAGKAAKSVKFLTPGNLKELLLQGKESEVDLIVVSRSNGTQFKLDSVLIRTHLAGIPLVTLATLTTNLTGCVKIHQVEGWEFISGAVPQTPLIRLAAKIRSLIEPLVAAIMLIAFAPLMGLIALILKKDSPGPVFYTQNRTGYLGKHFTLIKFRSMRIDAEKDGIQWSSKNDHRVTAFGKFLRKTRLDELPQLINVIKGEMSFFGPRPERPEIYKELLKDIPLFSLRTLVKPGITGWAQVVAGYAASIEQSKTKLEYDLYYIQNNSPRLDLVILAKTLIVAIFGDRAEKRGELAEAPTIAVAKLTNDLDPKEKIG